MNFSNAMIMLKQGKKVKRAVWDKRRVIGVDSTAVVDALDILADDWEVSQTMLSDVEPGQKFEFRCNRGNPLLSLQNNFFKVIDGKKVMKWVYMDCKENSLHGTNEDAAVDILS